MQHAECWQQKGGSKPEEMTKLKIYDKITVRSSDPYPDDNRLQ